MHFAGIDIGSRTIELVVVDAAGEVLTSLQADTGFDPLEQAGVLTGAADYDTILATGYGRSLFEVEFDAPTVTEIKAHARGARELFPRARGVLDIGGQDSKAIALGPDGRVKKFEMNDRCAAGTGKFLEVMAQALGYSIEDFGSAALAAKHNLSISSMCTVFAESEVTTLIAKGKDRLEIARGLHASVVERVAGMLSRLTLEGDVVFTGGVALNPCVQELLREKLGLHILVPEQPQAVGAYGAALIAVESARRAATAEV